MLLDSKIEAILFFKGEPVTIKQLVTILNVSKEETQEALVILKEKLQNRGIRLVSDGEKVMLGTSPDVHDLIEVLKKDEISKELGKASLETLSVILYNGPVRKSEIDYIRGVNSASILRNLMIRGLIERKSDNENQKSFLYYPTIDLISFLGISNLNELPEYEKVKKELEKHTASDEIGEEKSGDNVE